MITGIEHVAICAQDTVALKDWYVEMFDFDVVYDNGNGTFFVAAPDGSMLEVMPAASPTPHATPNDGGIRHFALSISPCCFDKMVARLKGAAVDVVADVVEKNEVKTFFFRDIEGNIFHLICRPKPLIS